MRRFLPWAFRGVLVLSLAANGVLGWAAWRAQAEYRALARQFVRVKQEAARAAVAAGAPATASAVAQGSVPAGPVPASAGAAPAPAATDSAAAATSAATPAPAADARTGPTLTVEQVRGQYQPRLLAVQADCEGQLNAMLDEAKAEYDLAKEQGKSLDIGAVGAKYFTRAESLQRGCDQRVERLLSEMGADLRAAGLSTDLVAEVRDYYQSRIVERRAEILSKAGQ